MLRHDLTDLIEREREREERETRERETIDNRLHSPFEREEEMALT